MATAYTSLLGLALPVQGELQGTWGDTVNNAITSLLDTAVAGTTTLSTDADVTLSTTTGAANQARQAILLWTANGTVTRNITAPAQSKIYTVINNSAGTQSIVIRGVGPTTGVTIPKGKAVQVVWNGSDFVELSPNSITGNLTVGGNLTVNGNTTLGDAAADTLTVNSTITSNLIFTDNTYDIGASGATRPRSLFLGTNLTVGSLTSTRVPYASTGGLLVDSANLTFNGTTLTSAGFSGPLNGTVGATTPSSGAFTTLSATGVTTVQAGTVSAPAITTSGDTNTGIFFPAADTIAFTEGGVESARFDSSGNFLINATTNSLNARVRIATATRTANFFDLTATGGENWVINSTNTTGSTDVLGIYANGATGLYIQDTGNVGIGTSTINTTLAVNGNALIGTGAWPTNDFGRSGSRFVNASSTEDGIFAIVNMQSGVAANRGGYLYLGARATTGVDGATFASIQGQRENATSGNYSSFLGFSTTSSIGVIGERARIDSSGNLGLGVTPSAWSGIRAMQIGAAGSHIGALTSSALPDLYIGTNCFYNGSNWIYVASGGYRATRYQQTNLGQHQWFVENNGGTPGNAITFTQAMTLDASGNLGIGTSSPASKLYISGGTTNTARIDGSTGGGGWLVLRNGTVSGGIYNTGAIIGDTTSGVGIFAETGLDVRFYTNGSATERMRLDTSGNLGVGRDSALDNYRVTFEKGNDKHLILNATTSGNGVYTTMAFANQGTAKTYLYWYSTDSRFYVQNNTLGVYLALNGTAWTSASDERLKTDLTPITDAVSKVATLRAVTGRFIKDEETTSRSFLIAQDVQAVFPQAVDADDPEKLGVRYTDTIPLLVAAIKELNAKVEALEAQLKGNA